MLYKFKSKATADLIMLEPHARQVLTALGQAPSARGIVLPAAMPAAIAALQAAVALEAKQTREDKEAKEATANADANDAAQPNASAERAISLAQRAAPFMEMLRRAHAANAEVVWGV